MNNRSKSRMINGIVSAVIVCLFLAHAALGSTAASGVARAFSWLIWFGLALVVAHVVLSVITSYEQLTDTVRPPSQKKKQHLVLKWISGILLLGFAAVHVFRMRVFDYGAALHSPVGTAVIVALSVVLAMHIWTGSKSVLKDLGIDKKYRPLVRLVACTAALLFSAAALASMTA